VQIWAMRVKASFTAPQNCEALTQDFRAVVTAKREGYGVRKKEERTGSGRLVLLPLKWMLLSRMP